MGERLFATGPAGDPVEIDTSVAHAARIYDYYLGGTTNFAVDRAAAERSAAVHPGGIATVRASVLANRAFLERAVRHLAAEVGVRQFLDIGTGIPTQGNVHEVAQQITPASRIVYVDNDPIVLAHAHALLRSTSEGATAYLQADLRDPATILKQAAETLDFGSPVAVMLLGILHFFPAQDDPYGIVATLLEEMPSGSHLVISHLAEDIYAVEMAEVASRMNRMTQETWVLRPRADVERFFDGLELVAPGVVQVDQWRPDGPPTSTEGRLNPLYAGVGRKR
jgi:hypothetical protein